MCPCRCVECYMHVIFPFSSYFPMQTEICGGYDTFELYKLTPVVASAAASKGSSACSDRAYAQVLHTLFTVMHFVVSALRRHKTSILVGCMYRGSERGMTCFSWLRCAFAGLKKLTFRVRGGDTEGGRVPNDVFSLYNIFFLEMQLVFKFVPSAGSTIARIFDTHDLASLVWANIIPCCSYALCPPYLDRSSWNSNIHSRS